MEELPIVPSCPLDETDFVAQLERYLAAGRRARLLERTARHLVIEVDEAVDRQQIEEMVAVERECCPYFTLDWRPEERRLAVSVSAAEHELALDSLAFALGVRSFG